MLKGSIPAIVTPMKNDENEGEHPEIDFENFKNILKWQIGENSDGLVICGTTGEGPTIDDSEFEELLKIAVSTAAKNIPIIAGCAGNCTKFVVKKALKIKELGADVAMIVTPFYNKPTQDGLYMHYSKISKNVDIPILMYNVPGRTGVDMKPETIARVAHAHSNVIGVKDASGEIERVSKLREICPKSFLIFSGEDHSGMESSLQGGNGCISVTANIAPRLCHEMQMAALSGKREEAEKINKKLIKLHESLFIETNPIPTKWLLAHMGKLNSAELRLPLMKLTNNKNGEKLIEALKEIS
eukprot:GHVL01019354.1.p1 GENE.GHVL01019354.1~~GHVL01019354.1.p1  ORF type:complete len:299 (-),score=69.06 GHVL01019354.1:195-1091(-)